MNAKMKTARDRLTKMLKENELTAGIYVRVYGDHLIAGRKEPAGCEGVLEDQDRVRFTRLSATTYGLSIKRHHGRWERTPFSGTMEEMMNTVLTFMQHLVAPF